MSAEIRASMRKVLGQPGAVILRVPSQLSIVAAEELRKIRKPYGVEVVGDASAAFAPGVVKVQGPRSAAPVVFAIAAEDLP